jgi:hypothetical protein
MVHSGKNQAKVEENCGLLNLNLSLSLLFLSTIDYRRLTAAFMTTMSYVH